MQSDVLAPANVNSDELARLYDLLDEYGRSLIEPTNRPLNVLIFEAFHGWEVQKIVKENKVCWPDGFNFTTEEIRWVWLETGCWVNYSDDNGRPREEFGLHGYDGSEGNFVSRPKPLPIPDYVQSLDDALELRDHLPSDGKLQIVELEGDFLTLWRAVLIARDGDVYEDEAATPSVAVLKAVLKQLLRSPDQLNWPKFGAPS
jgi:hypothetical protein